jgi:hypothetical protein
MVASVELGITPSPWAASSKLSVRHVMPTLTRVAAENRFITFPTFRFQARPLPEGFGNSPAS